MENLLPPSQNLPQPRKQKEIRPETVRLKFLRIINVICLLIFANFYSLAFIFVGFTQHYLVLMIEAILFPGMNLFYLNMTHQSKIKFTKYISVLVYGFGLINFSICAIYTFMAFIHTEEKDDVELQRTGKWMLTFIALYLVQIGSFILNSKEFKNVYFDNQDLFEVDDESEDDEKTNSSNEGNSDGDELSEEESPQNNDKMEIIYIS
ncbi:UNKNOWN [Stylonychia lemnae]|uniref:Transmembrane protein n=1 Tax=Stylonychia lemnae TaxID=5949 RepID=A0A077ZXA9_STYLE|nr:UNKNOWN [Stylonychia lemnae]|eukprot:CDW74530.1 UNKNOWN [Stylonychia lemnae]